MPAPAVEFLGQAYGAPIVASAFFAKPQPTGLGVDLNIQIIIGPADNGWHCNDATLPMDKRVMEFRTTQEADAVLGSGNLLDAIHAAKTPSRDSRFASGPVRILALNTRANTAAAAALNHGGGGQYTLRANVPGQRGNTIRIRVSDAGDALEMMDAVTQFRESGLARDDLSIQYTGDATTAALSFDGENLRITLAGDQTDGTADLDIEIGSTPTIRDLAERVSAQAGYQASWLSNQDLSSANLDHQAGLDVLAAPAILRSTFWRQNSRIRAWGYCEAIEPTGGHHPLTDTPAFVYLAGGARGAETTADYLQALDLQASQSGFYLNVCSIVTAVHAKLFEVVVQGNSPRGSRERFGGCGADTTQPIADRFAAGKALNSEYLAFGASPVTLFRADGITRKTYDGWMLAVLHNAIKAGANVRENRIPQGPEYSGRSGGGRSRRREGDAERLYGCGPQNHRSLSHRLRCHDVQRHQFDFEQVPAGLSRARDQQGSTRIPDREFPGRSADRPAGAGNGAHHDQNPAGDSQPFRSHVCAGVRLALRERVHRRSCLR